MVRTSRKHHRRVKRSRSVACQWMFRSKFPSLPYVRHMKKLLPVLLLACPLALSSCKKKLTHFYIDYTTEITVPATLTAVFPFSIQTPPVGTNSTYEFEDHDTRKEKIQ